MSGWASWIIRYQPVWLFLTNTNGGARKRVVEYSPCLVLSLDLLFYLALEPAPL